MLESDDQIDSLPALFYWECRGSKVIALGQFGIQINDMRVRFRCLDVKTIISLKTLLVRIGCRWLEITDLTKGKVEMMHDPTTNIHTDRM